MRGTPGFAVSFLFVSICDFMHSIHAPTVSPASGRHGGWFRWWVRQPVAWVMLWAAWALLALGYLTYRDALDGLICRAAA